MNDQTAQPMNQQMTQSDSYVDAYNPPATMTSGMPVATSMPTGANSQHAFSNDLRDDVQESALEDITSWLDTPEVQPSGATDDSIPDMARVTPLMTATPPKMSPQSPAPSNYSVNPQDLADFDDAAVPSMSAPAPGPADSELLEDQNIFDLLGVTDGTEQQRESFLDELQQVIWEDFLENDTKLLLTAEEQTELQSKISQSSGKSLEEQETVVVYLEKIIPDLEDIMLEKALELKADLFNERIIGMKEYLATDAEKLARVADVERMINQNQWRSAARLLNSLV